MTKEQKKWGIIYNPKAGTRKVQKRWQEIKKYMDSLDVAYDYVQSEGFGSVERLAGILADNGYRTIIVVGGDGALNDAINGVRGRRRRIDVGTCGYYDGQKHVTRYFLNAINIGLGARIVKITDQCKRFWGVKYLSYFMAFLSLIFERKLYRMHLKINDEHIRGRIMTVCIGSALGYGQLPSAVPYNGWLDVSVIHRPELRQLWGGLWMLIQGRILNHKLVKPFRTRQVKVLRARNAVVDLDGRILQERHFPLNIGILHEAITLIIP